MMRVSITAEIRAHNWTEEDSGKLLEHLNQVPGFESMLQFEIVATGQEGHVIYEKGDTTDV